LKKFSCIFLREFRYIDGFRTSRRYGYSQHGSFERIQYLASINYAGRALAGFRENEGIASTNSTLPLAVWPLVLAKARNPVFYSDLGHSIHDGIYYLLQKVQALRDGSKQQHKTKEKRLLEDKSAIMVESAGKPAEERKRKFDCWSMKPFVQLSILERSRH
jgi:hypothetical protein